MMKDKTLMVLAFCALGCASGLADEQPSSSLRLELSLSDGSRILGETTLPSMPLVSEALGKLDVPLGTVDAVFFSADHKSASVKFRNGDNIRGAIAGVNVFSLNTIFGPVSIPMQTVREMRVPRGGDRLVEWETLPFPKNSDWPGPRGESAKIEADEIVLRGQPVHTNQSYSTPLSFECEVTLEHLAANDGCIWVNFIPDGADPELDPPPETVHIQLGYHERNGNSGMLNFERARQIVKLCNTPFVFEAGKPYRLAIELTDDAIRVTLNGEVFERKLTLPFKTFHIQLMGWQPTNTWHVRNIAIH